MSGYSLPNEPVYLMYLASTFIYSISALAILSNLNYFLMSILIKISVNNNYNDIAAADINRIPTAEALRRYIQCG